MLQSKLLGETKKEWPKEATVKSHGLLIKGGYVKQMASGIYTLMPLAKRVTSKIENIIREEMENIDSQEILMPLVATKKLWDMSGRYDSVGSELLRFKDRNDAEMVLSMTHEEATVFSLLNEAKSYQKYPFSVFQIQTKFRDEARPRAGLIRVREFTMKDAYSFHTTQESLNKEYEKFYKAYERIYKRVGIPEVVAVASDTGMMGGSGAHEYMLLCDAGEDKIVVCKDCNYSANMEVAYSKQIQSFSTQEENVEKIYTPGVKTIEELQKFTSEDVRKIGKAVIYKRLDKNETIVVFIRADRQVNETKLRNLLKIDDEDLVQKVPEPNDNIVYGFVGPKNFKGNNVVVIYDNSLKNEKSLIFGANEENYHYKGINILRDVGEVQYVDVAKVEEEDCCPVCGKHSLSISNGIEVGNIFKLGDKYTKSMNMTYLDENGKEQNPLMGCYGIGVGRLMASVLEAKSTESEVIWPISIAPYAIHICALDYTKSDEVRLLSNELYTKLMELGYDVLLDDRNKTAGVKFADSELIGAPIKIIIGKKSLEKGNVEVAVSGNSEKTLINKSEVVNFVKNSADRLFEEVN